MERRFTTFRDELVRNIYQTKEKRELFTLLKIRKVPVINITVEYI